MEIKVIQEVKNAPSTPEVFVTLLKPLLIENLFTLLIEKLCKRLKKTIQRKDNPNNQYIKKILASLIPMKLQIKTVTYSSIHQAPFISLVNKKYCR